MNKDNIMVSICCMTYNQEKYIEDTLKGIVSQKTSFKYEAVIHDDASTDNTKKIIEKYEKKYPNLIKTIYEKENQYLKNVRIINIMNPYMKGKYIAFCEGDDYWYDNNKLQIQVDYMEKHADCSFCTHSFKRIDPDGDFICDEIPFNTDKKIFLTDYLRNKYNFQTATILCRGKYMRSLPPYYYNSPIGDLPQTLYFLSQGYGYYINNKMSCYRYMAASSWTLKNKNNIDLKIKNHEMVKKIYLEFNEENNNKYTELIDDYLLKFDFEFAISINNFNEIHKGKYKNLYKKLPIKEKIKISLKYNKFIYNLYKKLRYKEEICKKSQIQKNS